MFGSPLGGGRRNSQKKREGTVNGENPEEGLSLGVGGRDIGVKEYLFRKQGTPVDTRGKLH